MSKEEIYLSIIIPFRNEEKRIENTIKDILEYEKSKDFDIQLILADSHSNDKSIEIAKKYSEKFEHIEYTEPKTAFKKGLKTKGESVRDGIGAAKGKYVMFMDADSSTRIWEVDKLLPFAEKYDIVMGSRYIKEPRPYQPQYFKAVWRGIKSVIEVLVYGHSKDYMAKGKQDRLRQLFSRGGNLIFTVFLNQSYVDQRCGFKLYKNKVAKFLASMQTIVTFGFDTEYLAIAQKYKFKTIEVPVEWYDEAVHAKYKPSDALKEFKDLFAVLWKLIRGQYSKKHARRKLGSLYEEVILNWE